MPATYEPIASQTLGSDGASVTFSSVSGAYTDLILVANCSTSRGSQDGFGCQLNGETGGSTTTKYSVTRLTGDGSSAASVRQSTQAAIYWGACSGSSTERSVIVWHFMSYANTSVNKTALIAGAFASGQVARSVGLWRDTAAITSITVFPEVGPNFRSGSTFSLYGIKAA